MAAVEAGAEDPHGMLSSERVLQPKAYEDLKMWWKTTAPRMRARARWVFREPDFAPPKRQHKPKLVTSDKTPQQLDDEKIADEFKRNLYKTNNQQFFGVPKRLDANLDVWINAMGKSHVSLLAPSALTLVREWAVNATVRQRESFCDVLWSLQEYQVLRKGATETIKSYGWKTNPHAGQVAPIINPFYSSLGRPSSAPIAPEVHLKLERQMLQDIQNKALEAEKALTEAKLHERKVDKSVTTFRSTIPMKMAMLTKPLETTAQEAARSVPRARADGYPPAVEKKSLSSCPPASGGMGRLIGAPEWHGDAKYDQFFAAAQKAYTARSVGQRRS